METWRREDSLGQRKGYITVLKHHLLKGEWVIAFSGSLQQQYAVIQFLFFKENFGLVLESGKSSFLLHEIASNSILPAPNTTMSWDFLQYAAKWEGGNQTGFCFFAHNSSSCFGVQVQKKYKQLQ